MQRPFLLNAYPPLSRFFRLLTLAIIAPVSAWALNPTRALTQYGHDSWNYQTGLPGGAVYNVVQPTDGYIWLREASGLLRFDGVRFVSIVPKIGGQPVAENIRAVNITSQGELLVRCSSRTLILHGGEFHDAMPPSSLVDGLDRAVFRERDGTVWVGSDSNIWRYRGGNGTPIAEAIGWVSAITQDKSGAVWFGAASGLYRVAGDRIILFPTGYNANIERTSLPTERRITPTRLKTSVTAILEDKKGVLWVGTHSGLYKYVDGQIQQGEDTEPLKGVHISALVQDADGNIWAGTEGAGIYRYANGAWSGLGSADGLSDNAVCSLLVDAEGSLWIGTRSGLDRLRDTPLMTIGAREGLASDGAAAVTEGSDGSIYVSTTGEKITRIKDGVCSTILLREGIFADFSGALYAARDGNLWMGTDHGLCSFREGVITEHPGTALVGGFDISAIHEDDESLILGTSQLLMYRYKNGVLSPYDLPLVPGVGKETARYVCAMHRDENGTLWVGMTAGLYRVNRGDPPEKAVRTAFKSAVYSLYDDGKGSIWITGPDTRGFSRLVKADGRVVNYGPEAGIPVGDIGRVLSDGHDDLWLGTRGGVIRLARQEVDDFAAGRIKQLHPRAYGIMDGMKTEEAASNDRQPSAWRARDGRLYFATRKGVVVVDPDNLPCNLRIPPIMIEECLADKRVLPSDAAAVVPPGTENIEFHYTALALLAPSRVRFKYQLEGYDTGWVDAEGRRTAYYTHLSPGSYRFRVIGANEDGVWNETGAVMTLILRPHFYQTGWFYGLCTAGVGLAGLGLNRIWTRRLRRRQTELVSLVDERTRKLREEVVERTTAQQELQKYREYLEQLVAERTAALSQSNDRLQREIAERRAGEAALRASEDRYRRFFEEDLAGSFIANPAGQLLACNPAFARIFGFADCAAAAGLAFGALFQKPEEAAALMTRVKREGKIQDCDLELKRTDESPLYVLANVIASFDAAGQLQEIKGYLVDTTDRMRLENQLRQAQKMEAVGQLAGGVAHDFNNLLTAIIGSSECLIEDVAGQPETLQLAQEIRDAGQRAAALTRQLLAFSRKQVLQPRVFNLNEVVANMDKMLRRLIGEDIQLHRVLAPDLLHARADPNQIEQIIMNLAVNARDAVPPGGQVIIETFNSVLKTPLQRGAEVVPPGRYVCLQVRDTGCGMSPDVQSRVFEPFFTTKGPGKGSGLGLSTVYGIVQQSNGHVTFHSELGKGTTFCVFLPVVNAPVEPEAEATVSPESLQNLGKERILLVEDNPSVLKIAHRTLENAGFQVIAAALGREALERCRAVRGQIDLLLTDVVMPEMNGRELAEKIVAEFPSIKVLFMSGYTDDVLGRVGGVANVALLEKPFTPDALVRRVRAILDERL